MSTVILVTNDNEIKNTFKQNLVLLRGEDKLISVSYENAMEVIYEICPEVVIVHEHDKNAKTLELINYLNNKAIYKNTSVILLVNKYDNSFVLSAYDAGIDDFLVIGGDASEILIRTINGIKKSEIYSKNEEQVKILEQYGIVDSKSKFYSSKFDKEILETVLSYNNKSVYSYMIITPDDESKKRFSNENLIIAINKSVRSSDIIFGANGSRYSLLLKTNAEGAIRIFEKIKSEISSDYKLKAGITIVETKQAEDIKKRCTCALNNALLSDVDYVVYAKDEPLNDNWLDIPDSSNEQSYKFLKKVFSKKIENVIAPVFYRLQKAYEEKFPGSKIEQYTDIEQSVFRIVKDNNESRITMRYPAYTKLVIYISHSGLDTPENREIILTLNELTQKRIDEIVEDFLNEYMSMHNA